MFNTVQLLTLEDVIDYWTTLPIFICVAFHISQSINMDNPFFFFEPVFEVSKLECLSAYKKNTGKGGS